MSKHLAFFRLLAKSVLPALAALLAVMAAAEFFLFQHTAGRMDFENEMLTDLIDKSHLKIAAFVAIFACGWLLSSAQSLPGSRQDYTLRRLAISRRAMFLWRFLLCALCFLALWAAEAWSCFLLCRGFLASSDASWITGQTLVLTFYQNDFLHSLLPLADLAGWLLDLLFLLTFSLLAAAGGHYLSLNREKEREEVTPCENI